ncbi:MAG: DUF5050 domain-containing protein [Anaerolineales bacterium]|nr:DUF5050 domain-containing protein [Anaerolineales bacterium]
MAEGIPSGSASFQIELKSSQYTATPGSKVQVKFTLTNQKLEQDTFRVYLDGISPDWLAHPIPALTLSPGEKREALVEIETPPAPQVRAGLYEFTLRAVSQSAPAESASVPGSLTVAAQKAEGRVGVLLEQVNFSLIPGGRVEIPVVLINQGVGEDYFRLSVEGIPGSWISTSSPVTHLQGGEQKEVLLNVMAPRSAQTRAGRYSFRIQVYSQQSPDQITEVSGTVTVAAFTGFGCRLEPKSISSGESTQITVLNEGNTQEVFTVKWKSDDDALEFSPAPSQQLRLAPGEQAKVNFSASPRARPILGGEFNYAFAATVKNSKGETETLSGGVSARALVPFWVVPVFGLICLAFFCAVVLITFRPAFLANNATQTAVAFGRATETAQAIQTAIAQGTLDADSDNDGLKDIEELEIGTDPFNPDSDGDSLTDGDEVINRGTNPLNPDTDGDALRDGDEVTRGTDPLKPDTDADFLADGDEVNRGTDPLNPDSDSDALMDGDEVNRRTDPLNPDSDGDVLTDGDEVNRGTDPLKPDTDDDALRDGDEVSRGTDPLNPDTDQDQLQDGEEVNNIDTDPLNADTDADGFSDGIEVLELNSNPLDPNDPRDRMTQTAQAPTQGPTTGPTLIPTETSPAPTQQPPIQGQGRILFSSNREGNYEIYLLDTNTFGIGRLTIDPAIDTQPDWSPNGTQIVFTSNRSGNNEIYIMNADGTGVVNHSNNAADDRSPAWSPDGNWIAFSTNRDGNQEVYKVRTDGTELQNISNNSAEDFDPDWIKAGLLGSDSIAFTSNRDGNQEIYTMNNDGGAQVNITLNPANDSEANVSPNGDFILFTTNRDGNQEVYSINPGGSNPTNLSNNPAEDQAGAWSPNQQWVAFTTNRDGNKEIYVMRSNGTDVFNLTANPAQDEFPAWN